MKFHRLARPIHIHFHLHAGPGHHAGIHDHHVRSTGHHEAVGNEATAIHRLIPSKMTFHLQGVHQCQHAVRVGVVRLVSAAARVIHTIHPHLHTGATGEEQP